MNCSDLKRLLSDRSNREIKKGKALKEPAAVSGSVLGKYRMRASIYKQAPGSPESRVP